VSSLALRAAGTARQQRLSHARSERERERQRQRQRARAEAATCVRCALRESERQRDRETESERARERDRETESDRARARERQRAREREHQRRGFGLTARARMPRERERGGVREAVGPAGARRGARGSRHIQRRRVGRPAVGMPRERKHPPHGKWRVGSYFLPDGPRTCLGPLWGHIRPPVRTGSWAGPPRGKKAPRVGISSTVFGVRA